MDRRDFPAAFGGVIGQYHWESTPWWPEQPRPGTGTPNVVLIVLDDVGFAQIGCFGGSTATPAIDRLAAGGIRYSNFHTTSLCSPTRACVLTGRNHHAVGMGRITDLAAGFPGYHGRIPKRHGFLSEILTAEGFAAYAVGKWHLTPDEECSLAAPRRRWPLGRGFERFYGFHGGETHQFAPWLVHDNHFVDQPRSIADGYHLTEDLTDHALAFVRDLRAVDAAKPFFLYFATGACHSPHHAPAEWIDRYLGAFDHGWDVERERILRRQLDEGVLPGGTELSPRPEWVPAWDALTADERRLYARYMEAFAGYLSHTDAQIGRLLDGLVGTGDLENTLVMVLSDNGASSEGGKHGSVNDARAWNMMARPLDEALSRINEIGGPRVHNNYPWGWTVAGNTPFRRWKREVHEGGVCDPLVVSWPARLGGRGGVRRQYAHAIDVLPTVLDVLDVAPPPTIDGVEQTRIHGTSFAPTFDAPDVPSRHHVQYSEMFGCRALYEDGWKAVVYHPIQVDDPGLDRAGWELYHVDEDPSECHDLAADEPARLEAMIERWWEEAERYDVLPLDNRPFSAFVLDKPRAVPRRRRYVYFPGTGMVPESDAADVHNRSHMITADVEVPPAGADGVLVAVGNYLGGFTLFVRDGRLHYVHNVVGAELHRVDATEAVPPGAHRLGFRFVRTGEHRGDGELVVDDRVVGRGEIARTTPVKFNIVGAGLTVGADTGLAVCDDYEAPFRYGGILHRVTIELDGPAHVDPEGIADAALASQ